MIKIGPVEYSVWSGSAVRSLHFYLPKSLNWSVDYGLEFAASASCIVFCLPAVGCIFFLLTLPQLVLCHPLLLSKISSQLSRSMSVSFQLHLQMFFKHSARWYPVEILHDILWLTAGVEMHAMRANFLQPGCVGGIVLSLNAKDSL